MADSEGTVASIGNSVGSIRDGTFALDWVNCCWHYEGMEQKYGHASL